MKEPIMFHGGLQQQTKSGKSVWITHCCELTKRYHGLYLNRDGVWIATSWDENGMWQKLSESKPRRFSSGKNFCPKKFGYLS